MRVVHVLTQHVGGPVDHTVDVTAELAARGHDVHVVGPLAAGTARARAAGVTWHDVTMASKTDLAGGARLVRRLRDLRPDVLHLQDRRSGWVGRGLRPALGTGAVVYTLHGVPDGLADLVAGNAPAASRRRRDAPYYLHGERWVTRWGRARVVVPSEAVAAYARDHVGIPADRVDVVPNGVDPARFRPHAVDGPGPDLTAVWAGGLEPVKRPGWALDVVAATPGLRLLVLGDGPLLASLRARVAAEPALTGRVDLRGRVADPSGDLAAADLFLLTSAAENLPLSLLQAMATGLPVVATAVGGIPEVVRHGVDGLLVGADDAPGLVAAVGRLHGDPGLRAALGTAARRRIEDAWTVRHCVDGLVGVYDRALP